MQFIDIYEEKNSTHIHHYFHTFEFFDSTKKSARQQKLEVFLKRYRDAIENSNDSVTKLKIYSEMWWKHIHFIQDTLKFSTFPTHTLDTFYFEKVHVTLTNKNNKKFIEVVLENKFYIAMNFYDVTKNKNLQDIPIYKMLMSLKQNIPVLAVINLQDFSLGDQNIDKGIKKVFLALTIDSIYNIK